MGAASILTLLVVLYPIPAAAIGVWVSEQRLCATTSLAFSGVVVETKAKDISDDPNRGVASITTTVTLRTEDVIHGEDPGFVEIVIAGGDTGERAETFSGRHKYEVGQRYIHFLRERDVNSPDRDTWGAYRIVHAVRLYTDEPLSSHISLSLLQDVYQEHCHGGAESLVGPSPTRLVLNYLPPSFLRWCQHYDTPESMSAHDPSIQEGEHSVREDQTPTGQRFDPEASPKDAEPPRPP